MIATCAYAPEATPRQDPARSPSASVGTWTLTHRPEAAGEARKITTELLTRWSVTEGAADSVLLTVSELVTNAVEHARPPLNFGLSLDPGTQRVHVEVSDGGPAAADGDWAGS
ncbi:ATP-binding protein [Streptomyces yokosukanensis]|uniref:ATP-binding protein n=1 Tax=Streptomyces yokosukanensis TaxID=67386 RepID=UPI003448BCB7